MIPTKKMYTIFKIPKRKGGFRTIEAPNDSLKSAQRESLSVLKYHLKTAPFCHSFRNDRNIVTMARPHVDQKYVLASDIKDFFPSIKYEVFKRQFGKTIRARSGRFHKSLGTMLNIHFTDFEDGKEMRLPQGAPASPFLSNIFLFSFDWAMAWICFENGLEYSRYADDFVISGSNGKKVWTSWFIAKNKLKDLGLELNYKKIKFRSNKQRQMVCGLVVNKKVNIPKRWRQNLRAAKFQQKGAFDLNVRGRLAYMNQVYNCKIETPTSIKGCRALKILKEAQS